MSAFIEDQVTEAPASTRTACDRYNASRRARGLQALSPEEYGHRCDVMAVYKDGLTADERTWARGVLYLQDHPTSDRWGERPAEIPMPDYVREAFAKFAKKHGTTAQAVIKATERAR